MSDNSFSISTSQNVAINYEVAGIGERILADIIDLLIKFGYYICMYILLFLVIFTGAKSIALGICAFILMLPLLFYSLLFETFMQGQTPGKKLRKIKVVKIDGDQAGFSAFLIRWLFIFIDFFPFFPIIGLIAILASKKMQRIGDMIAQTTVIRLTDTVSLKDTIYERLHNSHNITYQEVRKLSETEVELIKKVLNTPEYLHNYDMVYSLTNKIQAKMNVTRAESFPEDFLRTVVKDYSAIDSE